MNLNTKANPNPNTSIAQKIAQAAHKNSKRANHVFDGQFGGQSGRISGGMVGGMGAVAGGMVSGSPAVTDKMVGGLGAAALSGLSPEAARDILSQRKDKLSALMTGYLRNQAGPVK
jgi:hypothetical protein